MMVTRGTRPLEMVVISSGVVEWLRRLTRMFLVGMAYINKVELTRVFIESMTISNREVTNCIIIRGGEIISKEGASHTGTINSMVATNSKGETHILH